MTTGRLHVTSPSRPTSDAVVIGIDYGTLSGRAVVVRVSDGQELGSAVHDYRHAVLDSALPTGEPLPPEWALPVPADYIAVLKIAVPQALRVSGVDPADVIGIGTDFTAGTMVATLVDGTPLCEVPASVQGVGEQPDRPASMSGYGRHEASMLPSRGIRRSPSAMARAR